MKILPEHYSLNSLFLMTKNKTLSYLVVPLLLSSIFSVSAHAVSIVLDGSDGLDSGSSCSKDAVYRFGTNTTYEGKQIDILLKVLDEKRLASTNCIQYEQASIKMTFGSIFGAPDSLHADIELLFVEKNTTTPVLLNVVTGIFKDLDRYITSSPDSVYLKGDHAVTLDAVTKVTYNSETELESSVGVEYEGKLTGSPEKCEITNAVAEVECKGIVYWKSTSKVNIRLATGNAKMRNFLLSFDLDEATDVNLGIDHGDAPVSYGDAYHLITSKLSIGIGAAADKESAAVYTDNADGDDVDSLQAIDYDDEDGVSSFPKLADGYSDYALDVVATNYTDLPAKLIGWIDFNKNGFFESTEAAIATVPINTNGAVFSLKWNITTSIPDGITYARFRISTDTALTAGTSTGYMFDGEVEDYNLTAASAAPFACNSDSYVFTSDAADSPTFASIIDLANDDSKSANSGQSFYSTNINATGYNLKDGHIWGYDIGNDLVVRVDNTFKVETYNVTGLPAEQYHVGDVSPEGILYLASRLYDGNAIHKVDANPLSPGYKTYLGKIDLNPPQYSDVLKTEYIADFALHPFDNHLYFIGWRDMVSGILYKVNTNTGLVTELGNVGIPMGSNPNTTWFDINGFMYFNDGDDVYKIDLSDPTAPNPKANYYTTLSIPTYGDAARCSRAPLTNFDYDYGDAPDTYGTDDTPGNSATGGDSIGPKHIIKPNLRLGSIAPDAETNGLASVDAQGDNSADSNDEEGVSGFPVLYASSTTYTIPAANISLSNTTGKNAILYGFIDFNKDGDFTDPGESSSVPVADNATSPSVGLSWTNLTGLVAGTTFARFRISTDTTLTANGGANDGEVEDYQLNIAVAPACVGYTGSMNAGISTNSKLKTGEKMFIASNTISPLEGHLKAYLLDSEGQPDREIWDASLQMSAQERKNRLYSTDSDGDKVLFTGLEQDLEVFNTNGLPTIPTILSYTMNPSYDNGSPYLGDRRRNSLLGSISPDSNVEVINDKVDTFRYLKDAAYKTFYRNTIRTRSSSTNASNPQRVLVTSDDGFLYAFNQSDGDLGWGWMPRSLIQELKNSASFYKQHYMQSKIDVMDLKSSGGSYSSYIIGSYKGGLGQYVLKLSNSSNLDSIIWDADHLITNSLNDKAPNNGQRAYFSDINAFTYSAYVVTNITGESVLHIRSLTDALTHKKIPLNFEATSTPYIVKKFKSSSAPAKNTLYLGSGDGKVYSVALLDSDGLLNTTSILQQNINATSIADLGVSTAITDLAIALAKDNSYYLRLQADEYLAIFSYKPTDATWIENWTTYIEGAKKRNSEGLMVNDSSNIQTLPLGAKITDSAYIVGNSVVLPVTVPPTGNNCFGTAYYYLYKLSNGNFPNDTFHRSADQVAITEPIALGYGKARKLGITNVLGTTKLMGHGIADQTLNGAAGINASFYINDPVATGVRSWREMH